MYADDIACYSKSRGIDDLFNNINDDLVNIARWYDSNHLSINIAKSNYLVFASKVMASRVDSTIDGLGLKILINDKALARANSAKYLGLIFSSDLSWDAHVDKVIRNINIQVGMMNRLKKFVPNRVLLTYYYANIQSHLFYALPIWGTYYDNSFTSLIVAQKRAIRIVDKADYLAPTAPIFTKYRVLDFYKLFAHASVCLTFNLLNGNYAQNININLVKNISLNSNCVINTRARNVGLLRTSTPRTNAGKFAFTFSGPWVWNQLPEAIRNEANFVIFKRLAKRFMGLSGIRRVV